MNRLHILLMVRQYAPVTGGMETATRDLAWGLIRQGHQVTVVTSRWSKAAKIRLPSYSVIDEVEVVRVGGFWRPLFIPWVKVASLPRADIIHVHGIDGLAWLAARAARTWGVPFVVTAHGGIFHTSVHAGAKRMLWQTGFRRILRQAELRISDGASDQVAFSDIGLSSTLIPVGIHLPHFADNSELRALDLLYLGRMAVHKGIEDLIVCVEYLQIQFGATLNVVLAGQDVDGVWKRVEGRASAVGIRYLGLVSDEEKWRLYRSARIVAFPSRYEGFGIGVVEAMHAGSVIAVSPLSHAADLVADGETGVHVPFHEPAIASSILLKLLGDSRRASDIGKRAAGRARIYDRADLSHRIEKLYLNLVRERSELEDAL